MPIAALSDITTSAITSSLVLTDAISVVKELLDNALDSSATNITIEISANTIDTIQVRDNGTGVGVEDRQLLCKRGYTSKIRTIEDLAQLGGSSLGFRGEALASIAELSKSVAVTTRVDGETVATLLSFDSKGKPASCSSASHSTGTTVRVSDFLKSIPVRKQTALKQATKTLSNLKRLLFDYAFARPTVRFQLKVLKSKSDLKDNWSYAPCKDTSNLALVASKIVGKDVASQCTQHSIASDDGSYRMDALLIAKECDASRLELSNKYISIDGRPVTAERGVMKDLSQTYKTYLRDTILGISNPAKQFFYLRLACPCGSYDVNIEPAKDEVLFEDHAKVLQLFEQLCVNVYGEKNTALGADTTPRKSKGANSGYDFNVLLAKKPRPLTDSIHALPSSPKPINQAIVDVGIPHSRVDVCQASDHQDVHLTKQMHSDECFNQAPEGVNRNMYMSNDDVAAFEAPKNDSSTRPDTTLVEDDEDAMNVHVRNPFVLAKMNTRIQPLNLSRTENISTSPDTDKNSVEDHGHPKNRDLASDEPRIMTSPRFLPSPGTSPCRNSPYQNPGPPTRPWKGRHEREDDSTDIELPTTPITQQAQPSRPTLLDSWSRTVNSSSPVKHPPQIFEARRLEVPDRSIGHTRQSPDKAKSTEERGMLTQSPRRFHFRTPFKNSSGASRRLSQDGNAVLSATLPPVGQTPHVMLPSPIPSDSNASPHFPGFQRPRLDPATELDDIMDFEHRKRDTILQHRGRPKHNKPSGSDSTLDQEDDRGQRVSVAALPHNKRSPIKHTDKTTVDTCHLNGKNQDVDVDIPEQPHSASYTQNPHWNRYRKAVRDLDERDVRAGGVAVNSRATSQAGQNNEVSDEPPNTESSLVLHETMLSPHDPRAYLIRQTCNANPDEGAQKKVSRTKTSKLPFETIAPDVATYMLVAQLDTLSVESREHVVGMRNRATQVDKHDPYVRLGVIEPAISGAAIGTATSQEWEFTVRRLVQHKTLSKPSGAESQAQPAANLPINLVGILQEHLARSKE